VTEAASSDGAIGFVGEGEFPAEFDRPNYGGAIFLVIWAFLYRVRGWRALLVSLIVVPLLIENVVLLFISAQRPFEIVQQVLGPVTFVVYLLAQAVFGLRANRIIWGQQAALFEASGGDPQRPIPIWRFRKSIRFWTRLGFGLVVLGVAVDAVLLVLRHTSWMEALASLPLTIVPLAAIFLIDLWRRSRVAAS